MGAFGVEKSKINLCLLANTIVQFIIVICINVSPSLFNPSPINFPYIHMFTAFSISIILINVYEIIKDYNNKNNNNNNNEDHDHNKSKETKITMEDLSDNNNNLTKQVSSYDILIDFQLSLSFISYMLNFYIQNYYLAFLWTIEWIFCLFYRGLNWEQCSLKYPKLNIFVISFFCNFQ